MKPPRQKPGPRKRYSEHFQLRMTSDERHQLEAVRGDLSASEWVRKAIRDAFAVPAKLLRRGMIGAGKAPEV